MNYRKSLVFLFFTIVCLTTQAQQKANFLLFKPEDVKLLPGIFKDAETTDLGYIMALEPDRLLSPFLREAGLKPKAKNYPNWENTGLDGHVGGHYLSALALMYASNGNKEVLGRLNYMLSELKKCQDQNGNGYIGGVPESRQLWASVASGKAQAGSFSINKGWVPLYNIHKTYTGLRDAYLFAHSELSKNMLIKFSDWMLAITAKLDDNQIQNLLKSEHGGLNEVFADVSVITGDPKYLELARKFSHQVILEPLEKKQDKLNGLHANTQIPKVIGFERIASISGDSSYHRAASFFWETVVGHRSSVIGGNSVREHFHPSNDFSSMINSEEGPETCNSYNMLKLTKMLYEQEGWEKYIDYYERTLYNHILSTQHPGKGGFVYFTPMRPGHYRVYSQPETSFWCCVGSGMENHAKYAELIYAHTDKDLFVNLFIPSRLKWKERGLVLSQETLFPDRETTSLTIEAVKKPDFELNIRYPAWVAAGALSIKINGKPEEFKAGPASYVTLSRKWKKGDKITVQLPMRTTTEQLPDGTDFVAVLHGPIVLAAKTDTLNMDGLFADESRGGHIAKGKKYPLQDMPFFVSSNADITSQIKPVANRPLSFTTTNLIYPVKDRSLELIPFFRLHDSRYIIYWQKVTAEKLQAIQQKVAETEAIKQKLDEATLDVVIPGEQQPESDHFIESEDTATGVTNDRHWRSAKGWFSYKMRNKNNEASKLRLTFFGADKNRRFKILVNNEEIASLNLNGSKGDVFYTTDYDIPKGVAKSSSVLTVKFIAEKGSETAGIYELRLMK